MFTHETPQDENDNERPDPISDNLPTGVNNDGLFVVAIGASSGGEEPLAEFFQNMPPNSDIAFLVLQHAKSNFQTLLADALARVTAMEVSVATNGTPIEANKVYILPTDAYTSISDNTVYFVDKPPAHEPLLVIDMLLTSLAETKGELGIGIIFSGRGSDGASGVKAIKEAGGLVIVQNPETAEFDEMPLKAIETNLIDYILSVDEIPEELLRYKKYASDYTGMLASNFEPGESSILQKIFMLIRAYKGHDFSLYKRKTVNRRLQRRIIINQVENLNAYYEYLQKNPDEINRLFHELLIGVTQFFRDAEAFTILEEKIIPQIFASKRPDDRIRIWIPGCSTGEEAYSLAILLQEQVELKKTHHRIQIFATDIDEEAIQVARAGVYPLTISSHVSQRRLQRFFTREENAYHVRKQIREMVTFAVQNVIKDPPFSKLDMISCRNLLIYLRPELQRKLIPLFHYVLLPSGILFLGTSETLNGFTDLFEPINRKWKFFRRVENRKTAHASFELPFSTPIKHTITPAKVSHGESNTMRDILEQILLDEYSPPAVLVNSEGDILYFHKRTDKYLEPVTGEVSINIIRMAREGLKIPVSTAIRRVQFQQQDVVYKGIQVKQNGDYQTINLTVKFLQNSDSLYNLILITFEDVEPQPRIDLLELDVDSVSESTQRIRDLEMELASAKEFLQAAVEELEVSNEELKSVNEELHASNEELQSTNEELETASEELQSVNEELTTANSELEHRLSELIDLNNDLSDLLLNVDVGIIFLDRQLRIRRFTPDATRFVSLIASDIGRPLADLVIRFDYENLLQDARRVLDTLATVRIDVQTEDDQWYLVKIAPYETIGGTIIGVVISFSDMSEQTHFEEQVHHFRRSDIVNFDLPFQKVVRLFEIAETWQTQARKVHSHQEAIDQFCHLLISQGDYAMAWVRLVDDESSENSSDGDGSAKQDAEHSLEKAKKNLTPSSQIVSTTAITLPLYLQYPMIIGTLHIYTQPPGIVSEQEIILLQRLANMLAQAIYWNRSSK